MKKTKKNQLLSFERLSVVELAPDMQNNVIGGLNTVGATTGATTHTGPGDDKPDLTNNTFDTFEVN